jgi:hypothetical protein
MSEKMTVICVSCDQPVFHGQPCPWCESHDTVVIEIETDESGEAPKLKVIEGGRRDEERRAA